MIWLTAFRRGLGRKDGGGVCFAFQAGVKQPKQEQVEKGEVAGILSLWKLKNARKNNWASESYTRLGVFGVCLGPKLALFMRKD